MRGRWGARATALAGVMSLGLAIAVAIAADSGSQSRAQVGTESPPPASTSEPALTMVPEPTTAAPTVAPSPSTVAQTSGLAWVELDRYALRPGEALQLRGGGFAPGETVRAALRDSAGERALGDLAADGVGSLAASPLPLPALDRGSYTLVLTGDQSGAVVERRLTVVGFDPWVVLDHYTLAPGTSTGLQGFGFQPGEAVQVHVDGATRPLQRAEADQQGELRIENLVRATPADVGKHRLVVRSESGRADLDTTYEVLPFYPVMTLAAYAGPPGAEVRFDGRGFAPGETVRILLGPDGRLQEVASFQADQDGAFQEAGPWRVPYNAQGGELRLVAEGEQSRVARDQTFQVVRHQPWLSLDQTSGPPGTQVTVQGAGFGAEEPVALSVAGRELATATADARGALADVGPLALPQDASGELELVAHGQETGAQASATFFSAQ
ncbi:MAG: hypothetical protein HY690_02880 [Chloroflexi bacterium]|nr:hypothetical protein [Chloroflexota bacterium]